MNHSRRKWRNTNNSLSRVADEGEQHTIKAKIKETTRKKSKEQNSIRIAGAAAAAAVVCVFFSSLFSSRLEILWQSYHV